MTYVLAATLLVGVAAFPSAGLAAAEPVTGQAEELSPGEWNEVLLETRRRMRHEDPAESDWSSLDRGKLARILRTKQFATLDGAEKVHLVDQAGAWDLMPFERPSDAWNLWASWFPGSPNYTVLDPDDKEERMPNGPQTYYADSHWAEGPSAMIALMTCLPSAAWYVRHKEPMVWAVESGQWHEPGHVPFGTCVRHQREEFWQPAAESRRGRVSARIIEDKLSAHLLASACSGTGPDSCLPLLHALVSLNPANPRLPGIIAKLEPSFELGKKYKIQPKADDYYAETCPTTPERREVLRKIIFLTAKIDLISQHGQGWKRGELESTLRQLLRHDLVLAQLGERPVFCRDRIAIDRYGFTNPLPRLGKADAAMWARLGREFSGPDGCRLPETFTGTPKPFNDACVKTRPAVKARRGLTGSGNGG